MAHPLDGPGTGDGRRDGGRRFVVILLLSLLGLIMGGAGGNPVLGLIVGGGLGALITRDQNHGRGGVQIGAPVRSGDTRITNFIDRAVLHGVIDRQTSFRLLEFLRRGMAPEPHREGTTMPMADRPAPSSAPTAPTPRAEPGPPGSPAGVPRPTPPPPTEGPVPSARPQPGASPRPKAAQRPIVSYEPRPRPARQPSPLAIGLKRVGRSAGTMWRAFSADVAIHTVIYLGVLLLALVMFAFYGLGFYGEIISGDKWRPWRPVVAAAVPALGFAVAALLRARTGIVFTANAIGFLAALALPIAMSSLFQDGAPWGPPDLDGPARWIGYAVVASVCAGVFTVAARRSRMYAYLVGPGIWTAAGALGLYLEDGIGLFRDGGLTAFSQFTSDGISWAQMAFVLAIIALSIPLARLARGGVVAAPMVRSAIVCIPVVATFGGAFAALQTSGGLDTEWAPTVLLVATGVAALSARGSSFAWDDAGDRLRTWLSRSLITVAIALIAGGWAATGLLGLEGPWIGAGLAGYATVLLLGGDRVHRGGRMMIAGIRLVGVVGTALSIFEPLACLVVWGAAAFATGAADVSNGWRTRWQRVYPLPPTGIEGTALIAGLSGFALFGAGRLFWGDGAGWMILGTAFAFAASRWAPERAPAIRGLSAWAIAFAGGGLAVAAYRWEELGTIERPMLGLHLLFAGAIVALAAIDWLVRLPIVTAVSVPGAALALRWLDIRGSVIDASVLATAGTVLLGLGFGLRARLAAEADVIGHVLVWLAPALGSPSEGGLLLGLSAVALSHLTVSIVVDRGRVEGRGPALLSPPASVTAHAVIGILALPWAAVLASREIAWFAAERPRVAVVFLAVGWLYAVMAGLMRLPAARRLHSAASQLLAVVAIGVAIPSSTAVLVTMWSAAALFALQAVRTRRAAASLPAWVMALAGAMVASARLGVSRADLHEPLFAGGVTLIGIGALAHRLAPRLRGWALPPLGVGLLVVPASLAFVIADQVHIVVFAGLAAATYAALIWLIHTGAFAALAVGMVAIGYADVVSVFEHPLLWLPLAATILALAAAQPPRMRGHWLAPVAPGLNVAWIAVLVLAGAVAVDTGDLDRVLLSSAILVALAALRWRSVPVAYGALVLVGCAGAVAGTGWLALALAFDSIVLGAHGTLRGDSLATWVLAPASAALGVGAVVSLGVWQAWSLQSTLAATAIVGLATGSLVIFFTFRRPQGRASIWVAPVAVVTQAALVTYAVIGWDLLGAPGRYGPVAAALAVEAVLTASSTVVWRRVEGAWATALLAGAAYVALGGWQAWSPAEALVASATPAVVLGASALFVDLAAAGSGLRLWEGPMHGLAQASAFTFASVGTGGEGIAPAGAFTCFLLFEAVTVGVVGTKLRMYETTWAASALGLGGIAAAGVWADLGVWPGIWLAFIVGLLLAGFASVAARVEAGTRVGLWRDATIGGSQVAWAVATFAGAASISSEAVSGLAALALGIDALFVGSLARHLPAELRLRSVSTVMAASAALVAVGAVDPDVGQALAILLAAAGAMMMIAGSYRESALGLWGEPVLVGGWVLAIGVPLLVQLRTPSSAILGTVLIIGGAGIIPGAIVSGRWRAIYLGMIEWGMAVPLFAGQWEITDANLVVAPSAACVLVVLAIERLRARLLEKPFTREIADAVSYVEVAVIVVPMVVAAWPAYERPSPGHLGLLAAEAALLVVWALFTQVRRRLAWGALGLVAVIVYPIARVLTVALRGGLSGGAMLGIGAVVALVLIVIGSLLERSRTRIGDVVRRLGEALEGWS